jgi:hypothetical protein
VVGDVAHEWAFDPRTSVVPADRAARRMLARIEPVAGERGEVDAVHVRDAPVDYGELLVMAVHRPLLRVELHPNLRPCDHRLARLAHVGA